MKVLFVAQYAPHRLKSIPIHVQTQMESLLSQGHSVSTFPFKQRSVFEKVKSFILLYLHLKKQQYDIIHCHFSYIGFAGLIASQEKNVIVSFMGSDLENYFSPRYSKNLIILNYLTKKLIQKSNDLKGVITKNKRHFELLTTQIKCPIINLPNGVNLEKFYPIKKELARQKININEKSNVIIFCTAKENNPIKNIELANEAIQILKSQIQVEFLKLSGYSQEELNYYYNAADVLLLTSLSEGSPNVIKEAMACNLPIVATKVGDIPERLRFDNESYITEFSPIEIADSLLKVLKNKRRSIGRELLINDNIDYQSTANKLIAFYNVNPSENRTIKELEKYQLNQ